MGISNITENLKTALESLFTYGGTPTVELERLYQRIGTRYPFIEVLGPYSEIETKMHNVTDTKNEYTLMYYTDYNDETQTDDSIAYVTRNVAGDIIKQVMLDITRGGYAIVTKVVGYGNGFESYEDRLDYFVYVVLEITARIDALDPSLLG